MFDDEDAKVEQRDVAFAGREFLPTSTYRRSRLQPGTSITGPAILKESGSTSLVQPNTEMTISENGSLMIELYIGVSPSFTRCL